MGLYGGVQTAEGANTATSYMMAAFQLPQAVRGVQWSPDGSLLAAATADGRLHFWCAAPYSLFILCAASISMAHRNGLYLDAYATRTRFALLAHGVPPDELSENSAEGAGPVS